MSLSARDLAFGFRERVVGRAIDLDVQPGEIVCLLGPNGSGKTTLLRTLLGLLAPRGGNVLLDHQALSEWPARERATRLAYVPQAAVLDFDFTLLEVVEMGRAARRRAFAAPSADDRAAALEALARMGIAALADRGFQHVSGGERQLALIARAIATGAPCLLMDEPTASLDFANQSLILDEIARLRARGSSVVFSTHHPDHALRIADRAVLLKAGRVVASGPTLEVLTSEHLGALYGRPVQVVRVDTPAGPRHVCVGA